MHQRRVAGVLGNADPIAILISSATSPRPRPRSGPDVLLDRGVQVEPAERHGPAGDDAAHRHDRHLGGPPSDVHDQVADGLVDRQARTDRGRERLLHQGHCSSRRRTGPPPRWLAARPPSCATRRAPGPGAAGTSRRPRFDHDLDHPLRDVVLGHHPAAHGADRDDVARVAADHLPRGLAHREHLARGAVQRDHRRLLEHDAVAQAVHERVRRAEIDRQVAAHVSSP